MSDYILKAITEDGQARAYVAVTTDMVNEAAKRHEMSPVAITAAGRLFTAGAMMGTMMKNDKDLLTVRIKGNGPIGQMMCSANPKGEVKGFVGNPQVMLPLKEGRIDVAGALGIGVLSVTKDLGLKEPYIGDTILVTSEIGDDLTYYFATSEQIPSTVGLGVLVAGDCSVKQAGGFIVQLMPFATENVISALEARLKDVKSVTAMLEAGLTPEDMLDRLLGDQDLLINDSFPVQYKCDCNRDRFARGLISLGRREIQEMIDDGKPVEVNCHFCDKKYVFTVKDMEDIFAAAKR